MDKYCKHLELSRALPGMVLYNALCDDKGDVLLPAGATLTQSIISSLERRGIEIIGIESEEPFDSAQEAERDRLQARSDKLFRKCGNENGMDILRQAIMQYQLSKIA